MQTDGVYVEESIAPFLVQCAADSEESEVEMPDKSFSIGSVVCGKSSMYRPAQRFASSLRFGTLTTRPGVYTTRRKIIMRTSAGAVSSRGELVDCAGARILGAASSSSVFSLKPTSALDGCVDFAVAISCACDAGGADEVGGATSA